MIDYMLGVLLSACACTCLVWLLNTFVDDFEQHTFTSMLKSATWGDVVVTCGILMMSWASFIIFTFAGLLIIVVGGGGVLFDRLIKLPIWSKKVYKDEK